MWLAFNIYVYAIIEVNQTLLYTLEGGHIVRSKDKDSSAADYYGVELSCSSHFREMVISC